MYETTRSFRSLSVRLHFPYIGVTRPVKVLLVTTGRSCLQINSISPFACLSFFSDEYDV